MKFSKEYEAQLLAMADGCQSVTQVLAKHVIDNSPPIKQPKGPNKLEQSYASHLELLKRVGEIVDYKFESVKLKIGVKTCWLTVDFWVLAKDGVTEFHETKGPFAREDSIVKLKSAALQYPHFRFFLVRKDGKRFTVEAVK